MNQTPENLPFTQAEKVLHYEGVKNDLERLANYLTTDIAAMVFKHAANISAERRWRAIRIIKSECEAVLAPPTGWFKWVKQFASSITLEEKIAATRMLLEMTKAYPAIMQESVETTITTVVASGGEENLILNYPEKFPRIANTPDDTPLPSPGRKFPGGDNRARLDRQNLSVFRPTGTGPERSGP